MNRIQELIDILNAANRAYHHENREIISDFEYDRLYDELVRLEKETEVVLAGSPTRKVGYEVVGSLTKATHDAPLLSLDKTKDPNALIEFLGEHTGLLSWKLDGLSIVLRYDNGALQQAVTRGNGTIGEDVTHNARVFANIPLTVPYKGKFSLRGEAVISLADFEAINAHEEVKYKNPRNLCSGAVRQLNSEEAAKRRVNFFAFGLLSGPDASLKSEQIQWIKSQGFDVTFYEKVTADTVVDAVTRFKAKIPSEPIASDGLVLTFDDIAHSRSLGATSKFPRDSLAFKWQDELAETTLLDIEWNTSRTGLINPVAIFEPVEIEGTQVSRASLHNVSILRGLELSVGDKITVYKANMIIPQIAENLSRRGDRPRSPENLHLCKIPANCPVCNGKSEIIGHPETLYCTNSNCDARQIQSLSHFVSRNAMNIDGLSEQTLEKFIANGFIRDYTDLFDLSRHEDSIINMDGLGRKSYDKLMAAIEASKNVAMPNFIYALGIPDVGLSNAKLLCAKFNNFDAIISEAARSTPAVFEDVKGIGEVTAGSLRAYFANVPGGDYFSALSGAVAKGVLTQRVANLITKHFQDESTLQDAAHHAPQDKPFGGIEGFGNEIIGNLRMFFTNEENLARLRRVLPLLRIQKPAEKTELPLAGQTFVITGDVTQFANRKALQEFIESHGGKVAGSVSAKTTYLINNDAGSTSGKNKKAAELGVPILTENDFMALLDTPTD